MKTETGVMIMKDGKAWGVVYDDGNSTAFGWVDPESAPIHNPQYCKDPTSVTWKGSRHMEELATGKVVPVRRITTVEILGEAAQPVPDIADQTRSMSADTEINNTVEGPPCSPSLGCSIEEFRSFVDTLQVGDRVIERGQSMMTGETGTIVMSKTPGHGKCVKWDTEFCEGTGLVTGITGGTRRLPEATREAADDGLCAADLFVGRRIRYESMEGKVEANPDYDPDANMEDYASGRLPVQCIYKWVVRSGTDGFYPESVLAHGGKLYPVNPSAEAGLERP